MAEPFRASLEAVARTVPITPAQGATIVSEIGGKLERWIALKQPLEVVVPGIGDVSLLKGGSVWWCRGHVVPVSRVVPALGALLASVLGMREERRTVPAGLLYVLARASDPRHLVPLSDLAEFRATLSRFMGPVPRTTIDVLIARYAVACSGLPPLGDRSTISDVRRLRRAGGVSLTQIAADTAIPVSLLRELEWGIYTHWNLPHARRWLDLYGERAGLDAAVIARIVDEEQAVEALPTSAPEDAAAFARGSERGIVPFALAALVAAAVAVGTPGDRTPVLRPRSSPVPRGALPAAAVLTAPAIARPEIVHARQQVKPPVRTAAPRTASANPPRPIPNANPGLRASRESHPNSHPLLRLARAMAGDGRYKVEPFPRVREEK